MQRLCVLIVTVSHLVISQSTSGEKLGSYRQQIRAMYMRVTVKHPTIFSALQLNGSIRALAPDIHKDSLLVLIDNSVLSVNETSHLTLPLTRKGSGDLNLNKPHDIVAFTNNTYLIADTYNSCLRLMNRKTLKVEEYSGKLKQPGNRDGELSWMLLNHPIGIIYDKSNDVLYIIDGASNSKLRGINVTRGTSMTIYSFSTPLKSGCIFGGSLALTYNHGVLIASLIETASLEIVNDIGCDSTGMVDGWFGEVTFNEPQDIAMVDDLLFVADAGNSAVRFIDFNVKKVATFCRPATKNKKKKISLSCDVMEPGRMVVAGDFIYYGGVAANNSRQIIRASITVSYNWFTIILTISIPVTQLILLIVFGSHLLKYKRKQKDRKPEPL